MGSGAVQVKGLAAAGSTPTTVPLPSERTFAEDLTKFGGSVKVVFVPTNANPHDNIYRDLGMMAFVQGERRIVPRDILVDNGSDAARSWYKGWDKANLDAPVEDDEDFNLFADPDFIRDSCIERSMGLT